GHQRLRGPAAAWLHRHGQRATFAGFHPEAVPVRAGAGRRPDRFAKPAGRRAAGFRRLPAGQFRRGVQRSGQCRRGLAALAQRAGGGRARPGRPDPLHSAAGQRRHRPGPARWRQTEPVDHPGRRGDAAREPGRRLHRVRQRPRRLLSPGAAWIIRNILGSNPADVEGAPLAGAIDRHANVAWKTGTSYGYRDAWAIGVTDRWTIGVWIGRPDGTPSPGQYGAVTALPLLFRIADML